MSATTVSVPKYRHHKGSSQAFVQVQGRRHYLGKWDSPQSKERYARFVAELAVSPVPTPLPLTTPEVQLTVVELCAAYADFAAGYYRKDGRPSGHLPQVKSSLKLIRDLYGHTEAAKFGPLALRAIQHKLIAAGVSRGYINAKADHIKRMFRWAVSHELLPPTVYQALAAVPGLRRGRTEARDTEPVLPVADETVNVTLPHLPVVVRDMVRFQRLTGARPGEVCQIRPMDVDRSGEVWLYRLESHKTEHHGRRRIIYIGPQAQDVLFPYLLRDAQAKCFSPAESEEKRHEEQRAQRRTRVQPTVLQAPGYDLPTGVFFRPHCVFSEIVDGPAHSDAIRARDALLEVVDDFPFGNDAHKAAWLAGVLTPFARYTFYGPAPLFLYDANVAGCGKSLLTDVTSIITAGRWPE